MESIKSALLETFKKNLEGLKRKKFTDSELSNIFLTMIEENKNINLDTSDLILLVEYTITEKNLNRYLFLIHVLSYMIKKGQEKVVERFFTQLRIEKKTLLKKMIQLTQNTKEEWRDIDLEKLDSLTKGMIKS